jgi:L-seryl-tRNA(Ser) seleniumtransferase
VGSDIQDLLRNLPGVDRVLLSVQRLAQDDWPLDLLTTEIQLQIAELRSRLLRKEIAAVPPIDILAQSVLTELQQLQSSSLKPVINATGILLHTNLGRAPLAKEALQQIQRAASGYSNLEINLSNGRRGSRYSHVEKLLCRLTGAESAMVVNNNAGAVLLALTALAKGKEAIVSRGELVEIGGSFRIPEVMEAGGVVLREVGSSNRTHLRDYQQAINDQSALLLKVHTSNYKIVGFTSSIKASELVALAKETGLPLVEDLGSGLLRPLPGLGLPEEPTISEALASGVDLLTCSGDKLLGGPQAGLILGRKDLIEKLRNHPLARALRIDKLSLAALEATLRLYLTGKESHIPLMAYFAISQQELSSRTHALMHQLDLPGLKVEISIAAAVVGGGAMPDAELPGPVIAIQSENLTLDQLATALRCNEPALVARIHDNKLLLNLRTVDPSDDQVIAEIFKTLLQSENAKQKL